MIELYHLPPSRSLRVLWVLEELQLDYQLRRLQFPVQQTAPEYLALNPAGLFPTLVDDGQVLSESLSICDHLVRKYGGGALLVEAGTPGYRRYLQWLLFGEATLGSPLANIMRYGPQQPVERHVPLVVQEATEAFKARLQMLELGLSAQGYMAGENLTLADVSVGYILWLAKTVFGMDALLQPKSAAYLDRLLLRPALQRALAR